MQSCTTPSNKNADEADSCHAQQHQCLPQATVSPCCPGSPTPWKSRLLQYSGYSIFLAVVALPILVFISAITAFLAAIVATVTLYFVVMCCVYIGLALAGRMPKPYRLEPLKHERHSIRLVEILLCAQFNALQYNVIHGKWKTSQCEALSYTWSCDRRRSLPALVGTEYVSLTATLSRAFIYLRRMDAPRRIGIDALCINQNDSKEKAAQLDVDSWGNLKTGCLDPAFQVITDCAAGHILKNQDSGHRVAQLRPGTYQAAVENIQLILNLKWWHRVWIIQEVVASANVTVQCRNHILEWDALCSFILQLPTEHGLTLDEGRNASVRRIQDLRHQRGVDAPYRLLSLTHDFRYSLATNERDRLYALRGLVVSAEHALQLTVDYKLTGKETWAQFTKECLVKYKSLNVFALIESRGYGLLGSWDAKQISWIPDRMGGFSLSSERRLAAFVRIPLWTDGGLAQTRNYSASGIAKAQFRTDLADLHVIGIRGYIVDEIDRVSAVYNGLVSENERFLVTAEWKAFIATCGHEDGPSESMCQAMQWFPGTNHSAHIPVNTAMLHLRRLITTRRQGYTRLLHSDAKPGDLVCILLGSDVPYVLRRSIHDGPLFMHSARRCSPMGCLREKHKRCCIPEVFTIVGQAYIDGIMNYPGDIEQDIESGVVLLQEFFLE